MHNVEKKFDNYISVRKSSVVDGKVVRTVRMIRPLGSITKNLDTRTVTVQNSTRKAHKKLSNEGINKEYRYIVAKDISGEVENVKC